MRETGTRQKNVVAAREGGRGSTHDSRRLRLKTPKRDRKYLYAVELHSGEAERELRRVRTYEFVVVDSTGKILDIRELMAASV